MNKFLIDVELEIHRKTPVPGFLFNKVTGLRTTTLLKKERKCLQVFSCEFCKICNKDFFREPLRVTASAEKQLKKYSRK